MSPERAFAFRLFNPHGRDGAAEADWVAAIRAGIVTADWITRHTIEGGRAVDRAVVCLRFAPPFADLVLEHEEVLTLEKNAHLRAARRHFGLG